MTEPAAFFLGQGQFAVPQADIEDSHDNGSKVRVAAVGIGRGEVPV